jgi:hypothetical protein
MNDEKATQLITRYLAVEQERADLRQKYLAPFSGVLPGKKVARLYQIENKMGRHHALRACAGDPGRRAVERAIR